MSLWGESKGQTEEERAGILAKHRARQMIIRMMTVVYMALVTCQAVTKGPTAEGG